MATLLHRDDGLSGTGTHGESIADLEVQVFAQFLRSKGRVLDLGCGRGRACVYLALQGNQVVGVDIDMPTLRFARKLRNENSASCDFVRADGRYLCFREGSYDYVVSLASTLSEKHRLWLDKRGRQEIIAEAGRVTAPNGLVIASFVHRYWSPRGMLGFTKHYFSWLREKFLRKRTELGDYTESIGGTPIRFHAFTIREAKALFPRVGVRLLVWRKPRRGIFVDWFFLAVRKTG